MEPVHVDLLLHLELARGPIQGSVEDVNGLRRPFYGWLGLSALLDDTCNGQVPPVPVDVAASQQETQAERQQTGGER
jgi:hypothetical protein